MLPPMPMSMLMIDTMWMVESGIVDGFIFIGPGPKDVIRQYTRKHEIATY